MTRCFGLAGIALDLQPQPADVHVDDPAVTEVPVAPDLRQQLLAAEHLALGAGQFGEQLELGPGQWQCLAVPRHLGTRYVDAQVADLDQLGLPCVGRLDPPQQCADPRRQFLRDQRLGHVVVRAGLQTGDHVVTVGARGHHDHRYVAGPPDLPADGEPVPVGQHQVQQDDVRRLPAQRGQGVVPVGGLRHLIALVLQGKPQYPPDPRLVVDQQQAVCHATQCRSRTSAMRVTGVMNPSCWGGGRLTSV